MSIPVMFTRGISRLISRHFSNGTGFKGTCLLPLNQSDTIIAPHKLDTDLDKYFKVINEIIIPDSMEIAPDIEGYPGRIKEGKRPFADTRGMYCKLVQRGIKAVNKENITSFCSKRSLLISYTVPAFDIYWNFGLELTYRFVAPPEHQTEENMTKARLLRAAMDITFAMSAVLDDIADVSDMRRGKPAWHKICSGGTMAGMYDGNILGYLPFNILRKHFRSDPSYGQLMELFAMANLKLQIGEIVDLLGHRAEPTLELQRGSMDYKAGHFVSVSPAIAMLHAGIFDEKLHRQAMAIFKVYGVLLQSWDDFNDYFSVQEVTGKPSCDLQNAGTTWVSMTAMKHFNQQQMKLFKECYGSNDPDKMNTVRQLYDEIDIAQKYIKYLRNVYLELVKMIEEVPHKGLRDASYSYADWILGDICDPYYEQMDLANVKIRLNKTK